MNDIHLDLLRRELLQRVTEGLNRTVHVTLHNEVELLEFSNRDPATQLLKRNRLLRPNPLFTLQLLTLGRDRPRFLFIFKAVELVPCRWCAIETQDRNGNRRTCFFHTRTAFVEHGLDLSGVLACQNRIAHPQRASFDKQVRHVSAALVERRLDHRTQGALFRIRLQLQHLRLKKDFLKQLLDVHARLGRDFLALVFATPILHEDVHLSQFLANLVRVCLRTIHLVDGKDHRNACRLRVVDGLFRLRHHRVIRCHNNDGQIRHLRTTSTHRREGLVTWGVQECHFPALGQFHAVCTNVLRDATRFTGNHICLPDEIEQRCLSVVDVTHDGHNRLSGHQVRLTVLLDVNGLLHFSRDELRLVPKLLNNNRNCFRIQSLVDGHHDAQSHARRDHVIDTGVHHVRQFRHRHEFSQLQRAGCCLLLREFLLCALLDGTSLGPAEFRRTRLLATTEACQGVLDFLLNVRLRDLALGLISTTAGFVLVVLTGCTAVATAGTSCLDRLVHIHFRDALPLPLAIVGLACWRPLFLDRKFNLADNRGARKLFHFCPHEFRLVSLPLLGLLRLDGCFFGLLLLQLCLGSLTLRLVRSQFRDGLGLRLQFRTLGLLFCLGLRLSLLVDRVQIQFAHHLQR